VQQDTDKVDRQNLASARSIASLGSRPGGGQGWFDPHRPAMISPSPGPIAPLSTLPLPLSQFLSFSRRFSMGFKPRNGPFETQPIPLPCLPATCISPDPYHHTAHSSCMSRSHLSLSTISQSTYPIATYPIRPNTKSESGYRAAPCWQVSCL
jgi:hypothetical protein